MSSQYCVLHGDVLEQLRALPDESVQCVVTSPPYWGLRDYKIPATVWGGIPECPHDWGEEVVQNATNNKTKTRWQHTRSGSDKETAPENRTAWKRTEVPQGRFCCHCGAWAGKFGLEPTIGLYLDHAVAIFREVRRVLKKRGTLWLNIGDSSCNSDKWGGRSGNLNKTSADGGFPREKRRASGSPAQQSNLAADFEGAPHRSPQAGIKPKDICMLPHRLAIALQADGWYVRKDIVWFKTNAMPESVKDRPTNAHEYVFLCSKSKRYYYDAGAIMTPASPNTHARVARAWGEEDDRRRQGVLPHKKQGDRHGNAIDAHIAKKVNGTGVGWGRNSENDPRDGRQGRPRHVSDSVPGVNPKAIESAPGSKQNASFSAAVVNPVVKVNARSVWPIPTQPYPDAHFATFPVRLVQPCILAGSAPGDVVLDPFAGSGTTLAVACVNGRHAIGIELGKPYLAMIHRRIDEYCGLLAEAVETPAFLPKARVKRAPVGHVPPAATESARFTVGERVLLQRSGIITKAWAGTDEAGEPNTFYAVSFPINRGAVVSETVHIPERDLFATEEHPHE